MPEQLRSETRTARKEHACGMCGATIRVGEKHHVSATVANGRVYDWRECAPCTDDRIVVEVFAWAGSPDEGVGVDSAYDWAHDCRDDETLGEIASRWLARHGCRCEDCLGHGGCACLQLCSMGPTCPGGMLAGLAGAGCWRGSES